MKALYLIILVILVLPFCKLEKEDKIICAINIIRHGARRMLYPIFYNISDPEYSKEEGRLTNVGKHQLYLLGRELGYKYIQEEKLLNIEYNPKEIIVKASGLNRTVESAQAVLAGLFHPGLGYSINSKQMEFAGPPIKVKDQDIMRKELRDSALPFYERPVTIHTTTAKNDYLFSPYTECTVLKAAEKTLRQHFSIVEKNNKNFAQNISRDYLKDLGYNMIPTVHQCYQLLDNMMAAERNGGKLKFNMTAEDRIKLKKAALTDSLDVFLKLDLKRKLINHILLYDTKKYFIDAKNEVKDYIKFALFQISDLHILSLHKLFGWELEDPVPYASIISFDLHKIIENGDVKYQIEAQYNGNKMQIESNLEGFLDFIGKQTFADEKEFLANCYEISVGYDRDTYIAISITLFFTFLFLWGSNWFIMTRKQEEKEEKDKKEIIVQT